MTIGDNKPLGPMESGKPAAITPMPKKTEQESKAEQAAKGAIGSQAPASAQVEYSAYEHPYNDKIGEVFAAQVTPIPTVIQEPDTKVAKEEAEPKIEKEKELTPEEIAELEQLLQTPLASEKGELDIRWAVVKQFAKDQDLPPLIKWEEIDKDKSEEAEFIKRSLKMLEKEQEKDVDIQRFHLALYAWANHVDPENRRVIIPVYEGAKLIGCRIIKSANKHPDKDLITRGRDKVLSRGRPVEIEHKLEAEQMGKTDYASLGMHLRHAKQISDAPKLMEREEINFRRGNELGERFVQTIYSIYFYSKKDKIKMRVFQKHAGIDLVEVCHRKIVISSENKNSITKQLLESLKDLKGKNLVHADIKSDNVLVSLENQNVKAVIGDLAAMSKGKESKPTFTVSYCSPEVAVIQDKIKRIEEKLSFALQGENQAEIEKLDKEYMSVRAEYDTVLGYSHDLWSMGCVLFNLWVDGTVPIPCFLDKGKRIKDQSLTLQRLIELKQNKKQTQFTKDLNYILDIKKVPENIKRVILACLVPDPQKREPVEKIIKLLG